MGFTLEALIVVPATLIIFTAMINFSVKTYETTVNKSKIEIKAIEYIHEDGKIWSNKIFYESKYDEWSFVTAVNPVKIKTSVDLIIDMFGIVTEQTPLIGEAFVLLNKND